MVENENSEPLKGQADGNSFLNDKENLENSKNDQQYVKIPELVNILK
jgi:hypothetical protein